MPRVPAGHRLASSCGMRWTRGYRSEHVEDRRGSGGGGLGGLINFLPLAGRLGGLGLLARVALLFIVPRFCGGGGGSEPGFGTSPHKSAGDDAERELVEFVSFVFDDIQQTWQREFDRRGEGYRTADLVLYTDAT